MIFHENRLLADDSYEISYLIFFQKLRKMSQYLSSAAVVIGALWVNVFFLNLPLTANGATHLTDWRSGVAPNYKTV